MTQAIAWIWKEFKEIIPATVFFLIAFHMIVVTKSVILDAYSVSVERVSTATVAALLVAKAILVVDKLSISKHFERVAWHNIAWKALLFYVVTALFHSLESLASYYLHYGTLSAKVSELFEWVSWPYFMVVQMWLVILILLFTLVREMVQLIGKDVLIKLMTHLSDELGPGR